MVSVLRNVYFVCKSIKCVVLKVLMFGIVPTYNSWNLYSSNNDCNGTFMYDIISRLSEILLFI